MKINLLCSMCQYVVRYTCKIMQFGKYNLLNLAKYLRSITLNISQKLY